MDNMMTIGQLNRTIDRNCKIYLQSSEDEEGRTRIMLTDYMRGSACLMSWAIQGLRPAKDREGFVAVIDLSVSLLKALEQV